MKRIVFGAVLVSFALLVFAGDLWAHGGQYRGPGGAVPPNQREPLDRAKIHSLRRLKIDHLKALYDFVGAAFQHQLPLLDHANVVGVAFQIGQAV